MSSVISIFFPFQPGIQAPDNIFRVFFQPETTLLFCGLVHRYLFKALHHGSCSLHIGQDQFGSLAGSIQIIFELSPGDTVGLIVISHPVSVSSTRLEAAVTLIPTGVLISCATPATKSTKCRQLFRLYQLHLGIP